VLLPALAIMAAGWLHIAGVDGVVGVAHQLGLAGYVFQPLTLIPAAIVWNRDLLARPRLSRLTTLRDQWPRVTHHLIPAAIALLVSVATLAPAALTQEQDPDEAQYAWSAAYFGGRMARLDFSPGGEDWRIDPGWSPPSFWTLTQPMGTRFFFAAVLGGTGMPAPALPYYYSEPKLQGEGSLVAPQTLFVLRMSAVALSAVAFSVLALRWGWPGLAGLALLLVPHLRDDLSRAWAEAPLLLGLALCAAAFRTRWFPVLCGIAASLKLTAVGLWPLVFLFHRAGTSRFARSLALAITVGVWTLLTPTAWFAGGPAFLSAMALNRAIEHAGQSADRGGPLGIYVPGRYLLPLEFLVALALVLAVFRLTTHLRVRVSTPRSIHHPALTPVLTG